MISLAKKTIPPASFCCLIIGLALQPSLATDPPDSELNLVSGLIETTDSVWQTDNHNIRHVINLGDGRRRETSMVTVDSADDHCPRLAITEDGGSWVVWWRDSQVDQVLISARPFSGGDWSTEKLVSTATEQSRNPEIVYDGTALWIAYEFDDPDGTSVGVQAIVDDPDPFGSRVIISTTDYAGDLDTMIHEEADHLWISWVDSGNEVGWSKYDYVSGDWDTESYEWYADDSVEAARERIRTTIIGQ